MTYLLHINKFGSFINNIQEAILKEGFELFQDNKMRYWYKKFSPEEGGNWYQYKMYWSILIYDPEMEWLKICVDFGCDAHEDEKGRLSEDDMDTLFEGYCPNAETFYTILKLVRFK